MGYSIPEAGDIKRMLSMLYDGLGVKEASALNLSSKENFYGLYVDAQNAPVALVAMDVDLAAYSSCALTMMPPAVANGAVKSCKLEDMMQANLCEVMNILSRLFMRGETSHLKFTTIHNGADLPDAVATITQNPGTQAWFEMDVPRYGSGLIGFILPA